MPPKDQEDLNQDPFKGELLARIDGAKQTVGAKLDGIQKEIELGFRDIRTNIDKVERSQIESWKKITDNSVDIGKNSEKIKTQNSINNSFKWVMGILITLSLANLGFLITIVRGN